MKYSIIALAVLASFLLLETDAESEMPFLLRKWVKHIQKYNLELDSVENYKRYYIFENNYEFIKNHNKKNTDFILGMNQFGHWTDEEYIKFLSGSYGYQQASVRQTESLKLNGNFTDIDWREKGLVSKIKDQKSCGSCWAFSTTGSLEGQYAKLKKKIVEVSEQELVDCSTEYGNDGCNGGLMDKAFNYVKEHGIVPEKDYPYVGRDGSCKRKNITSILKVSSIVDIPSKNEIALQEAIFEKGPISVAIDASDRQFRFYKSGVYTSTTCSSDNLDHGVLAVGLGSKPSKHYIVKNSWGLGWGDKGYILMDRNLKNICGIATFASYPKITA